jgi:hypothetical protein
LCASLLPWHAGMRVQARAAVQLAAERAALDGSGYSGAALSQEAASALSPGAVALVNGRAASSDIDLQAQLRGGPPPHPSTVLLTWIKFASLVDMCCPLCAQRHVCLGGSGTSAANLGLCECFHPPTTAKQSRIICM